MKPHNYLLVFFYLAVIGVFSNTFAQTASNKVQPNWESTSDWTNGAPTFVINQPTVLNHSSILSEVLVISSDLTISTDVDLINSGFVEVLSGGTLTVDGVFLINAGSIVVRTGGTLIVNGLLGGVSTGNIEIEDGATVLVSDIAGIEWTGNWSSIGSTSTITINGSVGLVGNMVVDGFITGTGNISIDGDLDLINGGIFGCSAPGNGCCGSGAVNFATNCFLPDGSSELFTSVQSGDWDDEATWDKNEVPNNEDDIRISAGHTVVFDKGNGVEIHNFTIEATATFYQNNKAVEIHGNYVNDGLHTVEKKALEFKKDGQTISGTGEINLISVNDNELLLLENNFTILSGTNLLIISNGPTLGVEITSTVTNNGTIQMAAHVLGTGTWVNDVNSELFIFQENFEVSLDANNGFNIVHYSDVANQDVIEPVDGEYWNLIIGGGGVKTLVTDIKILNFLVINSTLDVDDGADNGIEIHGDWLNKGTFFPHEGQVTFGGDNDSEVLCENCTQTFYDLTINIDSANVLLLSNVEVKRNLTFIKGNVFSSSFSLTLGENILNPGTLIHNNESFITGLFKRWVVDASGGVLFPVGSESSSYFLNFTSANIAEGLLAVDFLFSSPGNSGSPWTEGATTYYNTFADGYFRILPQFGFNSTDFELNVELSNFLGFPINNIETLVYRDLISSPWVFDGVHVSNDGSTIVRQNFTSFGEFALVDELNCATPAAPLFTISDLAVCLNETGVVYTVNDPGGVIWEWEVASGDIATGQGTNSITVDWGWDGVVGHVSVRAIDPGCGSGAISTVFVNVEPFITSSIIGREILSANSLGENYYVDNHVGYNYTWTVDGGVQVGGGNTNNIAIDWGGAGSGSVQVVADFTGCPPASAEIFNVTLFETYTTQQSGDYAVGTTWIGDVAPPDFSNVRIVEGHTVYLSNNAIANNIIIDSVAILQNMSFTYEIQNFYENYGLHDATQNIGQENVIFSSLTNDALLHGDGILDASSVIISNGSWTLDIFSFLTINADIFNISGSKFEIEGKLILGKDIQLSSGGLFNSSSIGSTVSYSGNSAQNISPVLENYYNLEFLGTGSKNLVSDIEIDGDFFDINGNLNSNSFNVSFSSNGIQHIYGNSVINFDNLSIENFSDVYPSIISNSDIYIGNTLSLKQGSLKMEPGTTMELSSFASTSSASTISFVEGNLVKNFNGVGSSFNFPCGSADKYAPVRIISSGTGKFSSEYFKAIYSDTTTDSTLAYVSASEHWVVESLDGLTADKLRFFYYDKQFSGVLDTFDLRLSNYVGLTPGGMWTETSPTPFDGTNFIEVSNVSSFGPFTLASKNGGNPLPIELLFFEAQYLGFNFVGLQWKTASEINNDFFTLERSQNGMDWSAIGTVDGAGNSVVPIDYSFVDNDPYLGLSYYRLKQTDFDGAFAYSEIETINITESSSLPIYLFPNPATNQITILGSEDELKDIKIFNNQGQDVTRFIQKMSADLISITYDISQLSAGMYTVASETTTRKLVKN